MAASGRQDEAAPLAPEIGDAQPAKQPLRGVWTVTTLDDSPAGDNNCTPESCTLRQATYHAHHGDRIVFKGNLQGTIGLLEELVLAPPLDDPGTLVVDGGGRIALAAAGPHRVVSVGMRVVELKGLVISGGVAPPVQEATADGGGIRNGGWLTLTGCTVTDNSAQRGGGIFNTAFGTLTLVNSTVSGNQATNNGGGLYNAAINGPGGRVTIARSVITGNSSQFGSGLFNEGDGTGIAKAVLTVLGTTVAANTQAINGGAIYNGGDLELRHSTLTLNDAESVGGVFSEAFGASALVMNTILAGNGGSSQCNEGGSFTSLGYNLTTGNSGCGFAEPTDVLVPPPLLFSAVLDPMLRDNGGPTLTHALIERGPAVDAGYCPGESTDQRGFTRPVDDPLMPNALESCDIGAFEWGASAPAQKGSKK